MKKPFAASALIFSFALFFWSTVTGLWHIWSTDGDYSYAFFIPLISAYIIWRKRNLISHVRPETNLAGGIFFLCFFVISLYGILGSSPSAVRPAIPLMIMAITLFCFGTDMFRILAFPLAILIFIIPLPTIAQAKIGVPLKLISTRLGEILLKLFGISVYVEGNVIDLGVTQLQVVDACSGLRYILPLFALGVIFAYFSEKQRWKQVVLAASTIPVAVLSNGLRIGATGILTKYWGPDAAEGFFHGFSGWLVFMFALGLLVACHKMLSAFFPGTTKRTIPEKPVRKIHGTVPKALSFPMIVCTVLLLSGAMAQYSTAALPGLGLKDGFSRFPLAISGWKGEAVPLDNDIISLSGAEEAFNAVFSDKGKSVSLYIGYRGTPFNESENFFHSPDVCLPSSGWKITNESDHSIHPVPVMGSIKVKKIEVEKDGNHQLVYYWFQTKKLSSNNVNMNRFHLSLHALKRDNTYDLFIRPITPLYPDETREDAARRMDSFITGMMPVLIEYISDQSKES
jgi:exosortase D (VPLPA-CTERM-specific)